MYFYVGPILKRMKSLTVKISNEYKKLGNQKVVGQKVKIPSA